MAVILKAVQNNNRKMQGAYGKYYPRVVHISTYDIDGLCEHISAHGSPWTDDIVSGVVRKFVSCIQELLLESNKVKLDGLGTFYLRPHYKVGVNEKGYPVFGGEDTEKDVNFENVMFSVGFTPDRSDNSKYTRPNVTRAARQKSLAALGLQEKPADEEGSSDPQEQGQGNSVVEDQP